MSRLFMVALFLEMCGPVFVNARLGMGAVVLTNSTFWDFVKENKKVLVDFYSKDDENWQNMQKELDGSVRQIRDMGCNVPVGKVDVGKETSLAQILAPGTRYPQLLWFLNGHQTQYHRTLRTAKSISDFVMALNRDPIIMITSDEQAKNYNRCILAHTTKASEIYKVMEVVASKHLDTVAFAVREGAADSALDNHNISFISDDAPAPVLYPGPMTVVGVEEWVRGLLVKSEAPPEGEPEEGEPVVVVGKTFEKMVLRQDKDVLLLVYAPWCGHSRKVFPVWQTLARATSHETHLVVAKLDGDRNSSPLPELFPWDAYPTIFFVKAGDRTPHIFAHKNRTVANLVAFANEFGTAPITVDEAVLAESDSESGLGEL